MWLFSFSFYFQSFGSSRTSIFYFFNGSYIFQNCWGGPAEAASENAETVSWLIRQQCSCKTANHSSSLSIRDRNILFEELQDKYLFDFRSSFRKLRILKNLLKITQFSSRFWSFATTRIEFRFELYYQMSGSGDLTWMFCSSGIVAIEPKFRVNFVLQWSLMVPVCT